MKQGAPGTGRGTGPENKNMGLSTEETLRMYEDIIMGTWYTYMPYTNIYSTHTRAPGRGVGGQTERESW